MWIQVRSMTDSKNSMQVDGISKLTKIEVVREKLVDHFNAPVDRQQLFFRGKQLVDGHTLFDYGVGINDLIQILVRKPRPVETSENENLSDKENEQPQTSASAETSDSQDSGFNEEGNVFKLGDIVDIRDETMGAWFEGTLVKIKLGKKAGIMESTDLNENKMVQSGGEKTEAPNKAIAHGVDDGFIYSVKFDSYDEEDPVDTSSKHIRPRAYRKVNLGDVKVGDNVMINYNYDEPTERGYWYDAVVTGKRVTRTLKELKATVYIGRDLLPFENCTVMFVDEIFLTEKQGTQKNINEVDGANFSPTKRKNKPDCDECLDNPRKKCKSCACHECGDKKDPEKQLMCDECDQAYHIYCLKPPLQAIPDDDEWYCPLCKVDRSEVVGAGEKLKESKKRAKMASTINKSSRDWGKGMACIGRTKHCTIVPPNHFGPIPGIEVGSLWKFRVQVSEAGVHRPHVAGIHGREQDGAYSIVLSGGYEDDVDDGDKFTYTGSGGRDLSGNKRTAAQSCDQKLTRMNRALAKCCNAKVDDKNGAEATDWKAGKPVRVVRNVKGRKHSKYAPVDGNRYDGIYKVVKYWPAKGQAGFIVWRYLFQRDDPTPAPWTSAGKKRTEELGLEMQYPEGYLESQAQKEKERTTEEDTEESDEEHGDKKRRKSKGGKGRKRKRIESDDEEEDSPATPSAPAKKKKAAYEVKAEVMSHINKDKKNSKLWEEALEARTDGAQAFISKVEEVFCCICCQDVVCSPVTTECSHNVCKSCLKRSFDAEVYNCPACRSELGKDYKAKENKHLAEALRGLLPGYECGR